MQLVKVTLGSGATPIIPQDPVVQRNAAWQTVVIGASAHTIYVGDSTVSVSGTVGVPIAVGGPALVIPTTLLTQNLNGWFIAGTSGDIVTVLLIE
jgi:hypothetical protein